MTPKEQESLFARVRERHPKTSLRMCSGFVHGVADEAKQTRPKKRYGMLVDSKQSYAKGYILGFITARGPDAFNDPRLKRFESSMAWTLDEYRWWEECSAETANDA